MSRVPRSGRGFVRGRSSPSINRKRGSIAIAKSKTRGGIPTACAASEGDDIPPHIASAKRRLSNPPSPQTAKRFRFNTELEDNASLLQTDIDPSTDWKQIANALRRSSAESSEINLEEDSADEGALEYLQALQDSPAPFEPKFPSEESFLVSTNEGPSVQTLRTSTDDMDPEIPSASHIHHDMIECARGLQGVIRRTEARIAMLEAHFNATSEGEVRPIRPVLRTNGRVGEGCTTSDTGGDMSSQNFEPAEAFLSSYMARVTSQGRIAFNGMEDVKATENIFSLTSMTSVAASKMFRNNV